MVVELGDTIDPALNARVRALDRSLERDPFDGYLEAIPSYRSLLVFYDPARAIYKDVERHIHQLAPGGISAEASEGPLKEVPTVYDGEDLDEVAHETGLSRREVIARHSGTEYLVYMVGFTPGFAYMGMTDPVLDLPRRASPRERVPAGAVATAMGQTGIYPSPTPGGWRLLGRAEHRTLFDVHADPPSFFLPGDRVRFVPVDALPALSPKLPATFAPEEPPSLEVQDGGLLTTVQDLGRTGYQRYGVPVAGAVDAPALRAANRLVGNDADAAGLECTVSGPRLRCLRTTVVAVTGAGLGVVVDRPDLGTFAPPPWSSFLLRPGNVLRFEGARRGARAYVALSGGIDVPLVLGSRSTYLTAGMGGFAGRALTHGDLLSCQPVALRPSAGQRSKQVETLSERPAAVRVVWGPQDAYFTKTARDTFVSATFTVAPSSDRMGYRLTGPPIAHLDATEIISDGMMLGGIQVPPNGAPIVMLADRATTGGYPKIATVITADLPRLGQLLPGDTLRFTAVGLDEARRALSASLAREEAGR